MIAASVIKPGHMHTFHINYHNNDVKVVQQDEDLFTVHLPRFTMRLQLRQDNEGANHWFEENRDNETAETRKIGQEIETYLSKRK